MHSREPRQHLASERGQSTVELALLLPVIVLLLFGVLEFGRVFNAWIVVTQASREGARIGATQCATNAACSGNVEAWVNNSLGGLDPANMTWDMTPGPYSAGGTLQVTVDYDVAITTPVISNLVGNTLTVHGATSMRLE
ncbi:MAG: TadE/TadG family type IV pilus assembly protein [Dehalococcoidia bacterium]